MCANPFSHARWNGASPDFFTIKMNNNKKQNNKERYKKKII